MNGWVNEVAGCVIGGAKEGKIKKSGPRWESAFVFIPVRESAYFFFSVAGAAGRVPSKASTRSTSGATTMPPLSITEFHFRL
jgi:hypothetical protein